MSVEISDQEHELLDVVAKVQELLYGVEIGYVFNNYENTEHDIQAALTELTRLKTALRQLRQKNKQRKKGNPT